MAQYNAYAQKIYRFIAGEAIEANEPVQLHGISTTVEDPTPGIGITGLCPTVSACDSSYNFIGVATEAASTGDWVSVCVEGIVDAQFANAEDIAVGDSLYVSAEGVFAEISSSKAQNVYDHQIVAIAAEADSGTSTATLKVYIPPHPVGIADING